TRYWWEIGYFRLKITCPMLNRLLPLLPGLFAATFAQAQCPPGQSALRLEIDPDQYFMEESWQLTNLDGSVVYARDSCYQPDLTIYNYCIPATGCSVFRIKDAYGDGMPDGYYLLYRDDSLIYYTASGDYGFGENVIFGCQPGEYCDQALPVDTGSWTTPANLAETWYRFIPAETGAYRISTCFAVNPCASKIWLYDHCSGIVLSNDQTGANFYAEGGCSTGAVATVFLAAGNPYYLRLGYSAGSCAGTPLHFSLVNTGAVVGCTDPAACNYNPLATVSEACIYPGSPDCPSGPDLAILEAELRSSLYFDIINNYDICYVNEGCLRGSGSRNVVRFNTHIRNIGNQDYYVGSPPASPATPSAQFVYDECHHHWHYRGYAEYILFNSAGLRLPVGSKNGFCLLDLECDTGSGKFECNNMGISAGCGDIYNAGLPCQWIDITGLPADTYTLVVRVNWDKSPDKVGRVEKSYANNWGQACFNLSYNGTTPGVEFLENACPQYTDCLGVPLGDAQPDCEGSCNGPVLRGDWDKNALRDTADLAAYLSAALAGNAVATDCRDLYADGQIDLYDAALLQECILYGNTLDHWGARFPCTFPAGLEDPADQVHIFAGLLDTVAKTFDIQIINAFHNLLGYALTVAGLDITAVENLDSTFQGAMQFDPASGRILALSATEKPIMKHYIPSNFLRVHYQQQTAAQACVASVEAVVNTKYQLSNAGLGTPACVSGSLSSVQEPGENTFPVYVQPNPFREETTLVFANPELEPVSVALLDLTGRVLLSYQDLRTETVTFARGNLPAGVYLYTLRTSKNQVSGKLMAW
ncbi:MAG: lysyl oxidase family protein, partial [Saprospiraceae bacterium]